MARQTVENELLYYRGIMHGFAKVRSTMCRLIDMIE